MKTLSRMLLAASLLAVALPAIAQEEKNEGVARTAIITPKAGHSDELLEAIEKYHKWIAQFEGHHRYNWYEIVSGPHTGKFAARTGGHNWADFDAEYDWQKESGEVFQRDVLPHIEHMEMHYTTDMDDMSHWPESFEGVTHFAIENWYVKNGQYGKFRRGLSKIVETLKAGGFKGHWGFISVASGGYGGQIQLVMPNKGWAGMSELEPSFFDVMSKELGGPEEFDAFMSDWGSTFKTGENWMVRRLEAASDYGTD